MTAPDSAPSSGHARARRVRAMVEELGPTFVKVGQFLSMRPDLIPAEYCEELLTLTDQAKPVPFASIHRILHEELGDPAIRFASFDPEPLAAGSLAQVHVARTHDGDEVAVKVQRPGIDAAIRADLRKARVLAQVLSLLGVSKALPPKQVAGELARWLGEELDLRAELRHVIHMHSLSEHSDIMVVPRPYPELSSARVLTCELLHGTTFSQVLRAVRSGNAQSLVDHDVDRLANNLLEVVFLQIFRYKFFHADVHPGNLLALPDGRIGVIDLALVDSLDPVVRRGTARYLTAMVDEDPAAMQRAVTDVLRTTEDTDLHAFQAELTAVNRELLRERARSVDGDRQRHIARGYMINVMRIARAKGLMVPPSMLSLYRSLLAAETIASQMSTSADLVAVGRRFFDRMHFRGWLDAFEPEQLQRVGLQLGNLVQNGPGQLARLLEDLADERFVLRVRSSDASERRQQQRSRVRLITLGLVAISLSVLVVGTPDRPLFGGPSMRAVLAAMLAVVYVALVLLWRRLR